jgi:hypothetical protein
LSLSRRGRSSLLLEAQYAERISSLVVSRAVALTSPGLSTPVSHLGAHFQVIPHGCCEGCGASVSVNRADADRSSMRITSELASILRMPKHVCT